MCHLQLATGSLQSHTLSAVAFSAMRPDGVVRFIFIFFFIAFFNKIQGEFKEGYL